MLAARVQKPWSEEARLRSLGDPEPIPVIWNLTSDPALMNQPRLISRDGDVLLTLDGRSDQVPALARAFRDTLKRRRLVITGGPGTGKTTLAVQLLLGLLATRAADLATVRKAKTSEVVPVPVLLPLSSWNTTTHPLLQDWLVDRLAPDLGKRTADALLSGGHILPILDGLDEIADGGPCRHNNRPQRLPRRQ
ncbi:hypothetical protein GCM10009555_064530 [Acrocarpospora macrocephala]|uniref:NACHT domain-containing protein n=1 Tax=Acrocarpospora macrocephala TaxID=150177 RepID=A0A5M3WL22_9ACTN|nr:hypothetical protein Amac_012080 [Acrocarpospora macrocephala]